MTWSLQQRGVNKQVKIPDNADIRTAEHYIELVENPFVSLEELTGIEFEQFPEEIDMDGLQTRKILRAMLHLLDAYNLKVYFPEEVPHEPKYEALRENWDIYMVKHLRFSGDDIELYTGDPMTCPFCEFCDCDDDLPDDEPINPSSGSLLDMDEPPF